MSTAMHDLKQNAFENISKMETDFHLSCGMHISYSHKTSCSYNNK